MTDWYWDLERKRAVTDDERGPGDHTLGPYRSKRSLPEPLRGLVG